MVSQCGDVTGPPPCGLFPFLSIAAAAGAAGRELLLGVLGAEALARDLDEVSAVGQAIEGGGGQQGLPEELGHSDRSRLEVKRIEPRSYLSLMTS